MSLWLLIEGWNDAVNATCKMFHHEKRMNLIFHHGRIKAVFLFVKTNVAIKSKKLKEKRPTFIGLEPFCGTRFLSIYKY